jgi:signal transduction histidine kinase
MPDPHTSILPDVDEALRIAGLNLRSLFDQFPFAVQVFGLDGYAVYENPAQNEMWGPPQDRAGQPPVFERPELDALGLLPFIRRGFAGETVAIPSTRYGPGAVPRAGFDRPRWVRSFLYPIRDEAGAVRAVVVMHIDVTEREETQQTLEQRVQERTHELSTLLDVSRNVAATLDLSALLDVILEQLKAVADYTGSTIMVAEGDFFRVLDDRGGDIPNQPNPEFTGLVWPLARLGSIWQALSRREPVIVADVRGDDEFARAYREANRDILDTPAIKHVRSWLAVPLEIGDRVIGYASISKDVPGFYTEHHARLATAIATHAAAAIENARLFERERRTAQELATLLEVARTATSTPELEPLLGLVLDQIKPLLDYTSAVVITRDGDGYRTREYRGPLPREIVLSRPVDLDSVPEAEAAYRRGEAFMIADVWGESEAARNYREGMGEEYLRTTASYLRCLMIAPLMHKGEVVGGLVLTHHTPGHFTPRDAALAQAVAGQVAGAIENARLFEQEHRTAQELASLLEVSRNLASTLELEPLLDMILDQVKVVADFTGAAIDLLEGDALRMVARRAPTAIEGPDRRALISDVDRGQALWRTLLRREPVIIADVRADEPLARAYRAAVGVRLESSHLSYVRSWMAVPLILTDRVIGIINISKDRPDAYTPRHAQLVAAIATQAAAAIENARLFERERRTAEELTTLLEVSRNLAATLDLQTLLGAIIDQAKVVADYHGASVLTFDDGALRIIYRRTLGETDLGERVGVTVPLERAGLFVQYILRREALIIDDVRADEPLARAYRTMMGGDPAELPHLRYVRSWMGVPLALKDRVIGVIVLAHSTPGYYTPHHAELVTAMASQAAAAIENARLYEQAHKLAALEERQRLARELHDSVSQVLFSIGLGARTARTLLERGDADRAGSSVEYLINLAEMGTAEMRALLFELRPESLAQEGLVAAIAKQAASLRARHSIEVEATLCDEPDVPLDVKEAIYRIAQEATHNTVKHARASRIAVRLACDDDGVTLQVEDNGQGFDPGGAFPGHLGLRSMQERVERLGGSFDIRSAPGAGAALRIHIPSRAR